MKPKMKKLFNVFLIGTFVFAILLVLPTITNADAISLEVLPTDEGSGGGSSVTSTPVPPPTPASTINLTSSLNKGAGPYAPSETMTFSASVYRSVCSNTVSNIKVEGYIVGQGSYATVIQNDAAGGTTLYGSRNYVAPSTPGNYTFSVRVNVYAPSYYYAKFVHDSLGIVGYASGDTYIKAEINADQELLNLPAGTTYTILFQPAGTQVIDSATVTIPFTVAAPALPNPTADITVTVDGVDHDASFVVPAGKDAYVYWTSTNATKGCSAKRIDSTTGDYPTPFSTSTSRSKTESEAFLNLQRETTFSLTCEN